MAITTKKECTSWPSLYCDGASRGNPGLAAAGAVLFAAGSQDTIFEISQAIGKATNNVAEYTALILGLEKSLEQNIEYVQIFIDSQLVVQQISGVYRVKSPSMRLLYNQAKKLLTKLNDYTISHVPREQNTHADSLANQALDRRIDS